MGQVRILYEPKTTLAEPNFVEPVVQNLALTNL